MARDDWEYFALNGEDSGKDRTKEVRAFVSELLRGWRVQVEDLVGVLESSLGEIGEVDGKRVAYGLLKERWLQIVRAIDGFLAAEE